MFRRRKPRVSEPQSFKPKQGTPLDQVQPEDDLKVPKKLDEFKLEDEKEILEERIQTRSEPRSQSKIAPPGTRPLSRRPSNSSSKNTTPIASRPPLTTNGSKLKAAAASSKLKSPTSRVPAASGLSSKNATPSKARIGASPKKTVPNKIERSNSKLGLKKTSSAPSTTSKTSKDSVNNLKVQSTGTTVDSSELVKASDDGIEVEAVVLEDKEAEVVASDSNDDEADQTDEKTEPAVAENKENVSSSDPNNENSGQSEDVTEEVDATEADNEGDVTADVPDDAEGSDKDDEVQDATAEAEPQTEEVEAENAEGVERNEDEKDDEVEEEGEKAESDDVKEVEMISEDKGAEQLEDGEGGGDQEDNDSNEGLTADEVADKELKLSQNNPDHPPPRYIEGMHGDMPEATRRWANTLEWRKENGIDGVIQEDNPQYEVIRKHYSHFFHGHGKSG